MSTRVQDGIRSGFKSAIVATAALFAGTCVYAQGTAFTYQGQLDDVGFPADGSYDLQFKVWDSSVGGGQVGGTLNQIGLPVDGGLFSTELDFGAVFNGADRWLEIGVQTNGGGGFTTLAPRTKFTSAPYAVRATIAASVAGGINDADSNPANELNTSVGLAGTTLQVTDAGGTKSVNLAALVNDADASAFNELNFSAGLTGSTLGITDAGGTLNVDLSPLVDDGDWAYFLGSGLSGSIYRSGDVALGQYTDPDGHGLNVQQYTGGHGAVRGADGSGGSVYAEGLLGVLSPTLAPVSFPVSTVVNAGVVGIKHDLGSDGAAVAGWNKDSGNVNYGAAFVADGAGTQNIALYARAENGAENLAGSFEGGVAVDGNMAIAGDASIDGLVVISNSLTVLELHAPSNPILEMHGGGDRKAWSQAYNDDLYIGTDQPGSIILYPDFTTALVANDSGQVGIGTASTFTELTVNGSVGFPNSTDPMLYINESGTFNAPRAVASHSPTYPGWGMFYDDTKDSFVFSSDSTNENAVAMEVAIGGDFVTINTRTRASGYELSVDGQIACEEVLVQDSGSWPDYVFEPDYNLRSLAEVEEHIKANKRLPGIPSAEIVAEEGLSIGQMQKRMMEKIEELTLYTIKQEKRIAELEARLVD
ncbi:hypothetical protein PDESU_02936 [Pontiella desulfatans]|uniref:Peptidase S74 domain-containing protein n=1 Tax=Pontiella desulfatans TaxID=2750659 RepID=A0A6C2U3D2_PONDE|nr:hypothetical protein [Pontiella desulfatans]VGO14375.1 hypothetical protein PDESU_02936 [Pontiella desulfatans]